MLNESRCVFSHEYFIGKKTTFDGVLKVLCNVKELFDIEEI